MPDANASAGKGFGIRIKDYFDNLRVILFSFVVGLWIGFLPGMGSGISNMVAYGYAKSTNKSKVAFGEGNPTGIWASETANNASLGGALIPMMALGIPGDGITAMLIAALTIHGLQAGPLFMTSQPDLAMLIFACVLVAAVVTFIVQIVAKNWFAYILRIPQCSTFMLCLLCACCRFLCLSADSLPVPWFLPSSCHRNLRAISEERSVWIKEVMHPSSHVRFLWRSCCWQCSVSYGRAFLSTSRSARRLLKKEEY